MSVLIWILLTALAVVELIGAVTKYPTISETIDRALRGKSVWFRVGALLAWAALGIHLFLGWLQ